MVVVIVVGVEVEMVAIKVVVEVILAVLFGDGGDGNSARQFMYNDAAS